MVHPTFWVKMVFWALSPIISDKFWMKLKYVSELSELEKYLELDKLGLPSVVVDYDRKRSGSGVGGGEGEGRCHPRHPSGSRTSRKGCRMRKEVSKRRIFFLNIINCFTLSPLGFGFDTTKHASPLTHTSLH